MRQQPTADRSVVDPFFSRSNESSRSVAIFTCGDIRTLDKQNFSRIVRNQQASLFSSGEAAKHRSLINGGRPNP